LEAKLATLRCKTLLLRNPDELENGWSNSQQSASVAEYSKESYASERAARSMMMMMMMMMVTMIGPLGSM
jgi:hypothetical protein